MQVEETSTDYHTTSLAKVIDNVFAEKKFYPSVEESLKNIIEKEGYISYKILNRAISTEGDNLVGELYEIDIEGETKDGKKESNIFLKQIFVTEAIKPLMNVNIGYTNEVFFYKELSNIFSLLQETTEIPEKERFNMIKHYDECHENAIILKNVAKIGFKTLNRMDIMSFKFAELSIKQLAKLHGLSFILKHKKADFFKNNIKMRQSALRFNKEWKQIALERFNNSLIYFDKDIQQKIETFLQQFYDKFPKYFNGDTKSIKCMCHGDFRTSNIMTKENSQEESEIIVFDYQFIFYGSPILDILYFIFMGSDRNFRKTHMDELKNVYYDTLAEYIKHFDLSIDDVYPKRVFEQDFHDILDFGLMVAIYIWPSVIFTEEVSDRFRERIIETVDEYIELGILK